MRENIQILFAEDNEMVSALIQRSLNKEGMQVDVVEDGLKVLEVIQHKAYDLLLLDIQIPLLNGVEVATKVVEELNLNIPIVALTASFTPEEKKEWETKGIVEVIKKPCSPKKLNSIIYQYINE